MEAATPAAPGTPAGPRRVEVGRVIEETFSLYGAHLAVLLGSAFVVFLISGILQGLLNDGGGIVLALLASVVSLVANALYTGFVVKLVEDVRADQKRDFTTGELFRSGSHAIWPLIGNGILKGIAVAIGLLLIIVPGLFLLTIWAVTSPAIVVERKGVFDAFGRSHELVKGQGWAVFGTILVAFLITIVIGAIAVAIGAAIGVVGLVIMSIVAGTLTAPINALVASILFFDLGGGSLATPSGTPDVVDPPPPPPPPTSTAPPTS